MIERKHYADLAARGCAAANQVVNALDESGELETPPPDASTVEEKTKHLKGKAEEASNRGNHREASDAHQARGLLHEQAGDHKAACDAYKDALGSLQRHADDCWWMAKK